MTTKTEYREYISSEAWQQRRKEFLKENLVCNRCDMPRAIAIIAYDQDLHVHHRSYANVGRELDSDLEPLCKRCHEIETFGSSALHKPTCYKCLDCGGPAWNAVLRLCVPCAMVQEWRLLINGAIAKFGVRVILAEIGELLEQDARSIAELRQGST